MTYDPNYQLKFKPTPIERLSKPPRKGYWLPMVGDPPCIDDYNARCWAVYLRMLNEKRRGLWFWA